jgi:hypothetical protein
LFTPETSWFMDLTSPLRMIDVANIVR